MGVVRTLTARYRIESDLRIGWTSPNWDRFASENDAAELTRGAVLGREGPADRGVHSEHVEEVPRHPGMTDVCGPIAPGHRTHHGLGEEHGVIDARNPLDHLDDVGWRHE